MHEHLHEHLRETVAKIGADPITRAPIRLYGPHVMITGAPCGAERADAAAALLDRIGSSGLTTSPPPCVVLDPWRLWSAPEGPGAEVVRDRGEVADALGDLGALTEVGTTVVLLDITAHQRCGGGPVDPTTAAAVAAAERAVHGRPPWPWVICTTPDADDAAAAGNDVLVRRVGLDSAGVRALRQARPWPTRTHIPLGTPPTPHPGWGTGEWELWRSGWHTATVPLTAGDAP